MSPIQRSGILLILLFFFVVKVSGQTQTESAELKSALQAKDYGKAARIAYDEGTRAWSEGNLDVAIRHLTQSMSWAKRSNSIPQTYHAATFLGKIYFEREDFSNAADYFNRGATLARELRLTDGVFNNCLREGESHARLNRYKKALVPVEAALQIALEKKAIDDQIICYRYLHSYYLKSGNSRKASEAANLLETLTTLQKKEALARESASSLANQAQQALAEKEESLEILTAQRERLRETEESLRDTEESLKETSESLKEVEAQNRQRELEISLLNKESELSRLRIEEQNARLENEALVRNSILVIILLCASLAGVMIVNYRKQVKTNKKIDQQNKNIKSSINYAKRIQEAMLPTGEFQKVLFPESFVLFKPRDLVSGDFYWFSPLPDEPDDLVFAAIDCTGHGVPGAFMSMIGFNSLNNIVNHGVSESGMILENLHGRIRKALQQDLTGNNDGMDLSLCIFRRKQKVLEFAGAKSPLVYIQNGKLFQVKGDIHPIGGSRSKGDQRFKKHEVAIEEPTMVYLFTDGFRDQFGGNENQKFMSKRFTQLLLEIHQLPPEEQHDKLSKTFEAWKGSNEQTDDVLVIGVRLEPAS